FMIALGCFSRDPCGLAIFFAMTKVFSRPTMQLQFVAAPLPAAAGADTNVPSGRKSKASQVLIAINIAPIFHLAMPQVEDSPGNATHSGARIAINAFTPRLEIIQMTVVVANDALDAFRMPVSAEGMGHHVVAAAGNACVVQ